MHLLNYDDLIREGAVELRGHLSKASHPLFKRRLRFLLSLKEGKYADRLAAGRAIGLSKAGTDKLWNKYKAEGLLSLLRYPYKGRLSKLSAADGERLRSELAKDHTKSLAEACDLVQAQFGIRYTVAAMSLIFKRLKIKKKTGRPTNIRKDVEGEATFKKRLSHT